MAGAKFTPENIGRLGRTELVIRGTIDLLAQKLKKIM